MQADGEHEEDEAELADEIEDAVIDLEAEVAEDNSREQHSRSPELYPAPANAAKREPGHRHGGQDQQRMRDRLCLAEIGKPVHRYVASATETSLGRF